jgi:3-oxoacyl-[acyl-carrier-protein] synthase II
MIERVAVTGIGAVSALGIGADATFDGVIAGRRGFRAVTLFDAADARCRIAAEVRRLDPELVASPEEAADFSRTDSMALVAAAEALARAGARDGRLGVILGGTTGGMLETEHGLLAGPLDRVEPQRVARLLSHPLDVTTQRIARLAGGAQRCSTVCAACSSSALAIAQGLAWLRAGSVDCVLAGGADGLCRLTFFGFDALGALDNEPCRPFDSGRRGLGLGEGAAFLCLEREGAARARGAEILGFLSGAAAGAEAHHITHPEPSGARAAELIRRALAGAGLEPSDLDYVNAHGTGTVQNDTMEARALHAALGEHAQRVLVSSTKGHVGHTLGAAGALEAVITVLAIHRGIAPATAGLETPEDPTLGHVLGTARSVPLRAAASCSFGFGGTGAVLVFEAASTPLRVRSPARVERVVVTGIAGIGPMGELTPGNVERFLESAASAPGGPLEPAPITLLDAERSRRFDPHAALVTLLAGQALVRAAIGPSGVGLVAGSAFGSVERSVRFILRAADRGVRRANPAEFPHLVASAASGNASIYLGLTGAVLTVSDDATSAEAAVATAVDALRLGGTPAFVAGAAEGFDPVVAEILGPLVTAEGSVPRSEGGGFLVVELESAARARAATRLAQLEGPWPLLSAFPAPWPRDRERALVIVATLRERALAALDASAWSTCPRRSVLRASGYHEAVSGLSLAAAATLVGLGVATEVLVVSSSERSDWVTLFREPETAR